jgi:hypothetical protein
LPSTGEPSTEPPQCRPDSEWREFALENATLRVRVASDNLCIPYIETAVDPHCGLASPWTAWTACTLGLRTRSFTQLVSVTGLCVTRITYRAHSCNDSHSSTSDSTTDSPTTTAEPATSSSSSSLLSDTSRDAAVSAAGIAAIDGGSPSAPGAGPSSSLSTGALVALVTLSVVLGVAVGTGGTVWWLHRRRHSFNFQQDRSTALVWDPVV